MTHHEDNPFRRPDSPEELMAGMWDVLHEVRAQVIATNGRVTALERWRIEIDAATAMKAREQEAYERGVRDTLAGGPLITKRQKALFATAAAAISLVAPTLFGLASGRW